MKIITNLLGMACFELPPETGSTLYGELRNNTYKIILSATLNEIIRGTTLNGIIRGTRLNQAADQPLTSTYQR